MPTIDEKRVFAAQEGATSVAVASELGVVVAQVSGDIVGEFSMAHACTARDVAAAPGTETAAGDATTSLAVATDEDVLVGDFSPTGFGPAVGVSVHDGAVLAVGTDGQVARYDGEAEAWTTLGQVTDPRAMDGPLVAAADGVHRVVGDDLRHAGLVDARDVAGRGVPLAATDAGLYYLGNGWMDVTLEGEAVPGPVEVVDADGGGRAHAVLGDDRVLACSTDVTREGAWGVDSTPTNERVVGVAYAPDLAVAATAGGTLLANAGEGWRSRRLGVRGVAGLATR